MAHVTALEAKTRLGMLLERVSDGEEITITRHGEPVAKLVPIRPHRAEDAVLAVESLAKLRAGLTKRKMRLSSREVKSFIVAGRR